ncbi:hypothetical protein KUCAC02_006369, partial [Chaenocephalus aceratus]
AKSEHTHCVARALWQASQCGTAWAEVPARCQGFVCHARSTAAIAPTAQLAL